MTTYKQWHWPIYVIVIVNITILKITKSILLAIIMINQYEKGSNEIAIFIFSAIR